MATGHANGAIQWAAADAVSATKTVSGLTFQPSWIRLWTMGISSAVDANSGAINMRRCGGFAVSTSSRRCIATFETDAAAASDCGVILRDDCCVTVTDGSGAGGGRMDINSFTSDGFTLIVDAQVSADITIFWEAGGGSDTTVAFVGSILEPAATGNQDVTATGLVAAATDQAVMFFGCQSVTAANTGEAQDDGFMAGYAVDSSQQVVTVTNADDGSGTIDTDHYSASGECIAMIPVAGGANTDANATFVQYNTDGFRLNWTARALTNRRYIFLAIKGGQWACGETTINVQTVNNTATVSGLAFQPVGMSIIAGAAAEEAAGATATQARMSIGCASSTSSRRCMAVVNENGVADVNLQISIEYDEVVAVMSTAGGVVQAIDLNSFNSDGFQLIVDTADATGSTTFWMGYLVCGSAAAAQSNAPRAYYSTMLRNA